MQWFGTNVQFEYAEESEIKVLLYGFTSVNEIVFASYLKGIEVLFFFRW